MRITKGDEFVAKVNQLHQHYVLLYWLPKRFDGWYCMAWCLDAHSDRKREIAADQIVQVTGKKFAWSSGAYREVERT